MLFVFNLDHRKKQELPIYLNNSKLSKDIENNFLRLRSEKVTIEKTKIKKTCIIEM